MRLPTTVLALGAVSFLTDLSSEMIYPLLPVFLTTVLAAGPVALGAIEGAAESLSALLKLVAGRLSDHTARKPLVVAGYAIAGAARPLIGLAGSWLAVLAIRMTDRVGKGLRSAPRDALIADAVPAERRGEAFGLQRSLDHAGAVAGPLVAAGLLAAGVSMRSVFLLAAVPAALVMVVLVAGVREARRTVVAASANGERQALGRPFTTYLVALALFTLGNSADSFLLLRLADTGVGTAAVALLWSAFHVVKMVATYAGGRVSDRAGRRPMVIAGWAVYAAVYLGLALASSPAVVIGLFLAYGLYFGLTEPVERAWVVDLVGAERRGTALGLYHGVVGAAALPASLGFGALWQAFGPATAFGTGAALAGLASLVLLAVPSRRP